MPTLSHDRRMLCTFYEYAGVLREYRMLLISDSEALVILLT